MMINTVYVRMLYSFVPKTSLCTQDIDGDGWGNNTISGSDCDDSDGLLNQDDVDEDGQSTCDGDCDDNDEFAFVGSAELESSEECMRDEDGDGFGDIDVGEGVVTGSDCDDGDIWYNQLDSDEDGQSTCDGDCDDADPSVEGLDIDGDGQSTCEDDCDDIDPFTYVGIA